MKRFIGCILVGMLFVAGCRTSEDRIADGTVADSTKVTLVILNRQIEDDPSNPELLHQRASYFVSTHDFDKALMDIRQAISFAPGKSSLYVTLSDIYLLTGKPDNCKEALVKAVELDPKDTEGLLKLGKFYLIVKDYPNCFATLKTLLSIDEINTAAYYTRSLALLEKGDTILAVRDLQKAIEYNQDFYDAYIQLGELYSIKKDPMAEMYLKNALNLKPQSREAMYMLGMYYQETGKYERAISAYENLARVDTSYREAPYNIGYIYLVYLKEFTKAIPFFSQSIKKDPTYYQAYYNRGYAYELAGDYAKAREDYEKTLKIEVNYDKAIQGLNRIDRKTIR